MMYAPYTYVSLDHGVGKYSISAAHMTSYIIVKRIREVFEYSGMSLLVT